MKPIVRILLPALAAFFFIGCASTQVNWNTRVGHTTYEQAVSELGQPTKTYKAADGKTVAEWTSRYYPANTTAMDNGFQYHSAAFSSGSTMNRWQESKLSLTFDTNNVLSAWSKED